eukprot:6633718-Prymnesium_polylepis.1
MGWEGVHLEGAGRRVGEGERMRLRCAVSRSCRTSPKVMPSLMRKTRLPSRSSTAHRPRTQKNISRATCKGGSGARRKAWEGADANCTIRYGWIG